MDHNYELQDVFLRHFFSSQFGKDFYLTGGTALARFYFYHRTSIDLDIFTQNQSIDMSYVSQSVIAIGSRLQWKLVKQVSADAFLQFIFEDATNTSLKVDIVKDIPVRFGDITKRGDVRLDSLENIGSNKVVAIFGRTDAKDFIDLYYILKNTQLTFDELYRFAEQKDTGLSELYLSYAMDKIAQVTQYPKLLKPLDRKAMIAYYQHLTKELLLRIKPKE